MRHSATMSQRSMARCQSLQGLSSWCPKFQRSHYDLFRWRIAVNETDGCHANCFNWPMGCLATQDRWSEQQYLHIPTIKMRRSCDCPFFKLGIIILVRQHLYIEMASKMPYIFPTNARYSMFLWVLMASSTWSNSLIIGIYPFAGHGDIFSCLLHPKLI